MSDYLTDDEQVDRIKKLWKDYGLTVVLALVVGVGGTVGWDYYKAYTETQSEEAAELYTSYIEATSLGEPSGLFVEELETEFGDSAYYIFTLMREAKAAVDSEDTELALEHLTNAQEVAMGTPIGDLIVLRKARLEFELQAYDDALETLLNVKSPAYRWRALMLKGDIHFEADELDLAHQAYQAASDGVPEGIDSSVVDMRLASVPADS